MRQKVASVELGLGVGVGVGLGVGVGVGVGVGLGLAYQVYFITLQSPQHASHESTVYTRT